MLDGTEDNDDWHTSPFISSAFLRSELLYYRDLDEYREDEHTIRLRDLIRGKKENMKNYVKNMELAIFLMLLVLVPSLKLLKFGMGFMAIPIILFIIGIIAMIVVSVSDADEYDDCPFGTYNVATILSQLLFIGVIYLACNYPQARTLHWLWAYPLITLVVKMVIFGVIRFIIFLFEFDLDDVDIHFKKDTKAYKIN